MGQLRGKLKQQRFKIGGFLLSLTPNSDGGTQNAYLGLYDSHTGRHFGTLDGRDLAKFAKALRPYERAQPDPELVE